MKYKEFNDWFLEIENFTLRGERFYEEFQYMSSERAIQWLQAAWECARMQGEENGNQENNQKEN